MGSEWREELEPGVGAIATLKTLAKGLMEPAVIAFLILVLTMAFWLPSVTFLFLLTWLIGMGPLFLWVFLGIGAVLFLSGMGHFVGWSVRLMPLAKELRAAKRSGRKPQIDLALDAWRIWSKRRKFPALHGHAVHLHHYPGVGCTGDGGLRTTHQDRRRIEGDQGRKRPGYDSTHGGKEVRAAGGTAKVEDGFRRVNWPDIPKSLRSVRPRLGETSKEITLNEQETRISVS